MWLPKSFASRLALAVLATFGLIQLLLCAYILVAREAEIRSDFDERLALRAASAVDAVETEFLRTQQLTLGSRGLSPTGAFALAGLYWQLSTKDGAVIERSPSLGDISLPLPTDDGADIHADGQLASIESWQDPMVNLLLGRAGALRIASIEARIEGVPPLVVQVARDVEPVTTAIVTLRRQLLVAIVIGLLLSGVAAWIIARRLRTGILSIVQQAQGITPDAPQRRIEPVAREGELRQLAHTLNTMLDGLESALRSREQFLADVSHELKAPLTALAAEARMMAAASKASDVCRQLDSAVQSVVGSLTGATDALLMLAQCTNGDVSPIASPVSLNEVVTDAVAHCLSRARPRAVRLIPRLPEEDDNELLVSGHADLLRVMLENLVRNAIDHSPDGAPVHVVLSAAGTHAELIVRDTGPGIPPDRLGSAFNGYQAQLTPSRPGGHGLGLGIARRVVEVHGGAIQIANRPAGGCEVIVRLPLSNAPATLAQQ
jgi:signal transduction histidine kinase